MIDYEKWQFWVNFQFLRHTWDDKRREGIKDLMLIMDYPLGKLISLDLVDP